MSAAVAIARIPSEDIMTLELTLEERSHLDQSSRILIGLFNRINANPKARLGRETAVAITVPASTVDMIGDLIQSRL